MNDDDYDDDHDDVDDDDEDSQGFTIAKSSEYDNDANPRHITVVTTRIFLSLSLSRAGEGGRERWRERESVALDWIFSIVCSS